MKLIAASLFLVPTAALAGPPFLTDDPEPTDTNHWEIYAPVLHGNGQGENYEGSLGTEINYGLAKDVQVTLGIPLAYTHDEDGYKSGFGDVAVSVKYRFFNDQANGIQIAMFPGMTLPTAKQGFGAGRVTALLPIWVQKDSGKWSIFGGGGYALNPGPDNQNYWTGGLNISRQVSERLLIGIEANRQGAGEIGGYGSTSLGFGAIMQLPKPFRLLASAGPTFHDNGGKADFHFFTALGLDF